MATTQRPQSHAPRNAADGVFPNVLRRLKLEGNGSGDARTRPNSCLVGTAGSFLACTFFGWSRRFAFCLFAPAAVCGPVGRQPDGVRRFAERISSRVAVRSCHAQLHAGLGPHHGWLGAANRLASEADIYARVASGRGGGFCGPGGSGRAVGLAPPRQLGQETRLASKNAVLGWRRIFWWMALLAAPLATWAMEGFFLRNSPESCTDRVRNPH